MALVTIADLERVPIYNSLTKSEASTGLKRLTEDSVGRKFDIFLSHSYLDARHIFAIKARYRRQN